MKQTYLLVGLLAVCAAGTATAQLNTDAMKKMQQQGHAIVEATQAQRSFRLANGQCLQAAGGTVVNGKCTDNASQKWRFDDKQRLVSQGGTCVSVAGGGKQAGTQVTLQQCAAASTQKWNLDGAKRLVNEFGVCLQADGGKVVSAACSNNANQKWG